MNEVILFLVFTLSCGLTYYVRRFALKNNIIDTPNERSSHVIPTPRGGGLAIVLSFYFALFAFFLSGAVESTVFYGLLGLSLIAIIGFIDDHNHVPARYRLLIHFAAAAWAGYWLGIIPWGDHDSQFILIMLWGITLFYLVWMLNLYNFMDGIDGIASVEAMSVMFSVILFLFLGEDNSADKSSNIELMMALFIALSGFIIWNWPPAKIFIGDVGSAFLGILIGSFSLITANNGSLDFSLWLILLAVFITDATYTLLVRLFSGEKVYEAHRSHAYQILSRQYGHKMVTLGILMINLFWLLPLACLGYFCPDFLLLCLLLAYIPLILIALKKRAGCHA